jgi:hypothetical protein
VPTSQPVGTDELLQRILLVGQVGVENENDENVGARLGCVRRSEGKIHVGVVSIEENARET